MSRILASWLVLAVTAGAAEAVRIDVPGAVLRPGIPLPVTVQGRPDLVFPVSLRWRILAHDTLLASGTQPLATAAQLARGVTVVAVPASDPGPGEVDVTLVGVDGVTVRASLALASATAVGGALAANRARSSEPAARLREEQLGEWLALWPVPTLAALAEAPAARATPLAPADVLLDPVDGSVQPVRRHPGPGSTWAVVLRPQAGVLKRRWPELAPAAITAAQQVGLGVVEAYPAGDTTFTGIAGRRIRRLMEGCPRPLLVAVGAAQAGAEALYRTEPGHWAGVITVADEAALGDPASWKTVTQPTGTVEPQPPLTTYADGPFVIVVGTGEHDAAAADNALLGETFRAAWAAHAHGVPPLITDAAYQAETWQGHRLVLVGSPRSNRVLAELRPRLAATWNDRGVLVDGAARNRQPPTFCALTAADPRHRGWSLTVIDGTWPEAWTTGMPLAAAGPAAAVLLPASGVARPAAGP